MTSVTHAPSTTDTAPLRADATVRPYAEIIVETNFNFIRPAPKRNARWDIERDGQQRESSIETNHT
jgi:hypothetical protein